MYSVYFINSDGGIFEFADLDKTQARLLKNELLRETRMDDATVEVLETFRTPYFMDTVLEEESNDDRE